MHNSWKRSTISSDTMPKRTYPFPKSAVVSYTMSRIRSKDTSIELALRKPLWEAGLRYRKHYSKAPGSPDIAFPRENVAVFCDSTFWHGRDWKKRKPRMKSNREYWVAKIERNIARDKRVNQELKGLKWHVIRFWDVDITESPLRCVAIIKAALNSRKVHA